MSEVWREPGSFRDPSGHILYARGNVYRSLDSDSYGLVRSLLQSLMYSELREKELIVETELVDHATQKALEQEEGLKDRSYILHKKLEFVTYPYEWSAEMLLDAGLSTLAVQMIALEHGFNLKDASAYNVQFDFSASGPTPLVIDITSIERLPDTGGLWLPYRQFLSHFILPLLYYHRLGYDFRPSLLANLDGLDPEEAYQLTGISRRFLPPYLTLVTTPHFLQRWETKGTGHRRRERAQPSELQRQKALFILRHTIQSQQKRLKRLSSSKAKSHWSKYEDTNSYSAEALLQKEDFVRMACRKITPVTVLDIGCNTGKFSMMAAEHGAKVLALDTDMASLDRLYRRAQEVKASVLPLRLDVTNPSPAIGWENKERSSFLERVGEIDCVFALAVVHHLLVGKGIPFTAIVALLHRLTNRYLVVELVGPEDSMFHRLLRGRDELYSDHTLETQKRLLSDHFALLQTQQISGMHRTLCLLEKR